MKNLSELTNTELIKINEYDFRDYEKSYLNEVNDEIEKRNIPLEEKRNIIICLNQIEKKFDSRGEKDIKIEAHEEEFHFSKYTNTIWYILQGIVVFFIASSLFSFGVGIMNFQRMGLLPLMIFIASIIIYSIMLIKIHKKNKNGWKLSVVIAFLMIIYSLGSIVEIVFYFGYKAISGYLLLWILQIILLIVFLVLLLNRNTVRFFKVNSKEFKKFILITLSVLAVIGIAIFRVYLLERGTRYNY